MTTLREQITARITAALTGATAAGAHVYRSREASISRDLTPAIVVMPDSERDSSFGMADRHEYIVNIAIFTRGDPWDFVADQVAELAHRVLMSDAQLQSLSTDIRKVSTDYESEEADRTAGTLSARYRIIYLTKASDIAAAP